MWRQQGSRIWTTRWSRTPLHTSYGITMTMTISRSLPLFRYSWFSGTAHREVLCTGPPAPLVQLRLGFGSTPTLPPSLLYSRFLWNAVGCHNGSISSSSGGGATTSGTATTTVTTIRYQHSSTQIKRLFRQHPARLRVEARMGIVRPPRRRAPTSDEHEATLDSTVPTKSLYLPLPEALQFAPIWTPHFLPNGWSAPPPPESDIAALIATRYPFAVRRTKNKPKDAVGFLPVYTKHRYVCFASSF
jgi:hypothetical protein